MYFEKLNKKILKAFAKNPQALEAVADCIEREEEVLDEELAKKILFSIAQYSAVLEAVVECLDIDYDEVKELCDDMVEDPNCPSAILELIVTKIDAEAQDSDTLHCRVAAHSNCNRNTFEVLLNHVRQGNDAAIGGGLYGMISNPNCPEEYRKEIFENVEEYSENTNWTNAVCNLYSYASRNSKLTADEICTIWEGFAKESQEYEFDTLGDFLDNCEENQPLIFYTIMEALMCLEEHENCQEDIRNEIQTILEKFNFHE